MIGASDQLRGRRRERGALIDEVQDYHSTWSGVDVDGIRIRFGNGRCAHVLDFLYYIRTVLFSGCSGRLLQHFCLHLGENVLQ